LLSTGWFQERIRAWFHNQTKINWGPCGRFTQMLNKPPRWISSKLKQSDFKNQAQLSGMCCIYQTISASLWVTPSWMNNCLKQKSKFKCQVPKIRPFHLKTFFYLYDNVYDRTKWSSLQRNGSVDVSFRDMN